MFQVLRICLFLTLVKFSFSYPIHASCKLTWSFPSTSCADIKTKINDQVTAWSGTSGCDNGGEKCLYEKVSEDATTLKLKHTTPVHKYVDDISFTFTTQGTGCEVQGSSRSEIWYAHLDFSTNYCNMHNLLTGSGLHQMAGFTEKTSDSMCTQYSSANCDKY